MCSVLATARAIKYWLLQQLGHRLMLRCQCALWPTKSWYFCCNLNQIRIESTAIGSLWFLIFTRFKLYPSQSYSTVLTQFGRLIKISNWYISNLFELYRILILRVLQGIKQLALTFLWREDKTKQEKTRQNKTAYVDN